MTTPAIPIVAPPTGTSSGGGSDPYGIGSAGKVPFDATGLGIGTNTTGVPGTALIAHFIQAGSGSDPAGAASIQHALYLAGFYPKDYTPLFGEVRKTDAQAFATALNLLSRANSAVPNGTGIGVTQFLTNQAALGVANSTGSAQSTLQNTVSNIRTPAPADVAAAAEKAFQSTLGRKPTPSERDAFVATYQQNYVGIEQANARAVYDAQIGRAQARLQARQQAAQTPAQQVQQGDVMGGARAHTQAAQAGIIGDGIAHNPPPGGLGGSLGTAIGGALSGIGQAVTNGEQDGQANQSATLNQSIQDLIDAASTTSPTADSLFQTVTRNTPPSPDVAAQDFARNTHPRQAAAHDIASAFDTFLSVLGGFGNGVH